MKITFYLITVLFLSSCLKRNETQVNKACLDSCMTINLKVGTDTKSIAPVGDVKVELSWSNPCSASPFCDYGRLIATGKTNGSGQLSFSFKALKKELTGGRFSLAIKDNADNFQPYVNLYGISKYDSVVMANLHLPSKATINIIFRNFNPTSTNDYFSVTPYFLDYGSDNLSVKLTNIDGGLPNSYFGGTLNSGFSKVELTGTTAGNQYTYFKILRKKNGSRQDLLDSIFVPKGEKRVYEIHY